ncbi:MAG: TetR/AcrR family transcriptional regulator [Acholeplasmataceae bacterium]|nr:TetR/AcrR family transcriptional regulator [Acholeplasmataceae bacterium]
MKTTERNILQAATALFSEFGYANVSTRSIAEAAGVNELTIFRHFKTKSNLLQAVIRHFSYEGNIIHKIQSEITGNLYDDIRIFTHVYYKFLENNIKLYKIQVREIGEEGQKFTNTIDYTEFMKTYFAKKAEEGCFKGDSRMVATGIVSMIMGIFTLKVYAPDIYEDTDFRELIDRFIIELQELHCVK